jgi:hypothetical protein
MSNLATSGVIHFNVMKFLFSLLFVLFSSLAVCQKVEITFKSVNQDSIFNYLAKYKISYDLDDLAILKNIKVFSNYSVTERLAVPEAYFFNTDGFLLKNKNKGVSCGATVKDLSKIIKSKIDSNQRLSNWFDELTFLGNETFLSEKYDLYILINWALFLDSYNETSFNWYRSLKEKKDLKIKVILVNLDVQESWDLTEGQKQYLGI